MPDNQQKWDALRTESKLEAPEMLFDTFHALIMHVKYPNASELIRAYQEREHAKNLVLRRFEQLLFWCICVVSMTEGSSSEEVDQSMQAYSNRDCKLSYSARLRTTVK